MTRISVDVDDKLLKAAREELGTDTDAATVTEALRLLFLRRHAADIMAALESAEMDYTGSADAWRYGGGRDFSRLAEDARFERGSLSQVRFRARVRRVDPVTRAAMIGVSWHPGCPVEIDDLRIIEMPHHGFDGEVHRGELMVHQDIARDVVRVFRELFRAGFPIRRMELVERYGGSDDESMAADNTSCFNHRPIERAPERTSNHSYGKAIDLNTVKNPYVLDDTVLPPAGRDHLDRTDVRPGMIVDGDVVVRAFAKYGFEWGGHWTTLKDYQHFEIPRREP
ncbi:M15 family metallopeptidase [Nocardioides speluncae]|uniref:M15 family metallopeptidase n=1 Tax=Nocardioides speluncae TaxID=2670337 RepID=UPI000D690AB5|nr:M15 family metallopeptidase [Nocardioides speluncae]